MAKYLNIEIPKPCHEDWNAMKPEEQGRYCSSCQKSVMDFTGLSVAQIANFFKKSKGQICGRFNVDQLGTDILMPRKRVPWVKYFFQITLPAFLFTYKAKAQGEVRLQNTHIVDSVKKTNTDSVPHEGRIIKGYIIDRLGNPIPFATIAIPGTNRSVSANASGYFYIKIYSNQKVLQISAKDYIKQDVPISDSSNYTNTISIILNRDKNYKDIMDEIIVTGSAIANVRIKNKDV